MYDEFSALYDRFVNWKARLAIELPFIERQLQAVGAHRVLDAACGSGMHAIALAERGYEVVGADLNTTMIERARANAQQAGLNVHFEAAAFGELARRVGRGFDAVLCLGNSLPHVLTPAELARVLADFAACLRRGGLLLVQNRNFDRVLDQQERWQEPQAYREGDTEWLFLRFYDWLADGTVSFNMVTLERQGDSNWTQQVASTHLWPQAQAELLAALAEAPFCNIASYGDMLGAPFDASSSPNLVLTARRC